MVIKLNKETLVSQLTGNAGLTDYIKLAVTDAVQDQVSIGVLSINNQIQKNK